MPVDERVRRATPEDIPALSELFSEVFGQQRAERVWHWKFFEHPVGASSWVFEAEGRIVAHCGSTAVSFSSHGRKTMALQLVDFMSHPRYSGGIGAGGIFARTTTAMFRDALSRTDAELLYGFPGERHRLVGERLLGYTTATRVGEIRIEPRGDDVGTRELSARDLDRFVKIPSALYAVREKEWLRWRYLNHPVASYEVVETPRRLLRRSRSFAVIRREGGLVHLMETGGSFAPQDVEALVRQLAGLGAPVVGWCSPQHMITKLFTEAGCELSIRDHSLAAAWFLEEPDPSKRRFFSSEAPRGSEFYFSMGDYDVY